MTKEKTSAFSYVKIFLIGVIVIILIAIFFRAVGSYYDRSFTHNTYNILVLSEKYVGVIGLDDNNESLSSVLVTKKTGDITRENIMFQSVNFGIPIHAIISYPNDKEPKAPTKNFFSLGNIQDMIVDRSLRIRNISFFDWMKLYVLGRKVESEKSITKSFGSIEDLNALLPDEDGALFRDSSLISRKTSLQVINGTNINGLATKVGEMYSRTGYNVVSVLTRPEMKESVIYYTGDEYEKDASFIAQSFKFDLVKSQQYQIADITLIIGEESELDFENSLD